MLLRFLPVGFLIFSTFLGSTLGSSSSGLFLRTWKTKMFICKARQTNEDVEYIWQTQIMYKARKWQACNLTYYAGKLAFTLKMLFLKLKVVNVNLEEHSELLGIYSNSLFRDKSVAVMTQIQNEYFE